MARKKRNGGRTTPRGTRPPNLRLVEEAADAGEPGVDFDFGDFDPLDEGDPLDNIISASADDLLNTDDPVAAEEWASMMLHAFDDGRLRAEEEGLDAPPFEELFLLQCRTRADLPAAIMASALAAVVPPPDDRLAASVGAELGEALGDLPDWVGRVGKVTPTEAWIAADLFGDQETVVVGFRQEGAASDHALVVLIDHNLSGQAKDAWLGENFEEVVAAWRSADDPEIHVEELPLADGLELVRNAMAVADEWVEDAENRSESYAEHRALIWARLTRAGFGDRIPNDTEVSEKRREQITAEFLGSDEGRQLEREGLASDVERLAHSVVALRADYDGEPLRWSPIAVEILLEYEAPRMLRLDQTGAEDFVVVLRAFVRFAGPRSSLTAELVQQTLAAIDAGKFQFLREMADTEAKLRPERP